MLISILILVVGVVIGGVIYFTANSTELERDQLRARIASQWQLTRVQVRKGLSNDELALLLQQCGFRIRPMTYYVLRFSFTGLALIYGVYSYVEGHGVLLLLLPILVWLIFGYKRPWPGYIVFDYLKNAYRYQLNKELFLMYVLIKNDLQAYRDRKRTMYDVLVKLVPYLPKINFALNHCLVMWQRDPKLALQTFAEDVGTDQAKDIAQVLYDIEQSRIDVALDILEHRLTSFRADRVSYFRQHLYVRGIIGYVLGSIGMAAVFFDIMKILSLYSQNLSSVF